VIPFAEFFKSQSPSNDILVNLVPCTGRRGVTTQIFFNEPDSEKGM